MTTELLTNLISAGFTEYEARVYLALLGEYPATGYQISKKAGIPRSMVYEALGRLHGRGAVLKTDDRRSTLYRPVAPDLLMDRYEQEQKKLVKTLREDLHLIYHPQEEDRIWAISGRDNVLSYAFQMIQSAHSELFLVLPDPDLSALGDEIAAAHKRGVGIRALLTGNKDLDIIRQNKDKKLQQPASLQIARHPPLESQLQELTNLLLVAADDLECLIASTDLERPEISTSPATVTNNRSLVLIARQFVWMELFAQRISYQFGQDLLSRLDPADQRVFENFLPPRTDPLAED
jgi:sugar-specific transcriptional regulator TrmB